MDPTRTSIGTLWKMEDPARSLRVTVRRDLLVPPRLYTDTCLLIFRLVQTSSCIGERRLTLDRETEYRVSTLQHGGRNVKFSEPPRV